MELNNCINFILTKAQNIVFQHFKAKLAKFDITPAQYGVLNVLWHEDGSTSKYIAECLNLDSSTITGIIDRMEKKELVNRMPNKEDRRSLKVVLTEKGFQLRKSIEEVIEESNHDILKVFSKEEQELVFQLLGRIASKD